MIHLSGGGIMEQIILNNLQEYQTWLQDIKERHQSACFEHSYPLNEDNPIIYGGWPTNAPSNFPCIIVWNFEYGREYDYFSSIIIDKFPTSTRKGNFDKKPVSFIITVKLFDRENIPQSADDISNLFY